MVGTKMNNPNDAGDALQYLDCDVDNSGIDRPAMGIGNKATMLDVGSIYFVTSVSFVTVKGTLVCTYVCA